MHAAPNTRQSPSRDGKMAAAPPQLLSDNAEQFDKRCRRLQIPLEENTRQEKRPSGESRIDSKRFARNFLEKKSAYSWPYMYYGRRSYSVQTGIKPDLERQGMEKAYQPVWRSEQEL